MGWMSDLEYGQRVCVFMDPGTCRRIWDVVKRTGCTDYYLPLSFYASFDRPSSNLDSCKTAFITFEQGGSIRLEDASNIWGAEHDKLLEEFKRKNEEEKEEIRKKAEEENWSSEKLNLELSIVGHDYPFELQYVDQPLVLDFKNFDEAMQDSHFRSLFDYPRTWWWTSHDHLAHILPILHARRNDLNAVIELFEDGYSEKYHILSEYRRKKQKELEEKYGHG